MVESRRVFMRVYIGLKEKQSQSLIFVPWFLVFSWDLDITKRNMHMQRVEIVCGFTSSLERCDKTICLSHLTLSFHSLFYLAHHTSDIASLPTSDLFPLRFIPHRAIN